MGGDALSVVLVVETKDARGDSAASNTQGWGIVFTQSVLAEGGEGAVIAFGSDVTRVQPFTTDHDKIEKSIKKLDDGGSRTRALRCDYGCRGDAARPADGAAAARDCRYFRSVGQRQHGKTGLALRAAQLENITIYTVGFRPLPRSGAHPQRELGRPGHAGSIGDSADRAGGIPPPTMASGAAGGGGDVLALAIWAVQNGVNAGKGARAGSGHAGDGRRTRADAA